MYLSISWSNNSLPYNIKLLIYFVISLYHKNIRATLDIYHKNIRACWCSHTGQPATSRNPPDRKTVTPSFCLCFPATSLRKHTTSDTGGSRYSSWLVVINSLILYEFVHSIQIGDHTSYGSKFHKSSQVCRERLLCVCPGLSAVQHQWMIWVLVSWDRVKTYRQSKGKIQFKKPSYLLFKPICGKDHIPVFWKFGGSIK